MDLPANYANAGDNARNKLKDECTLPTYVIEEWILTAAEIDGLSAMVLLDAADQCFDMMNVFEDGAFRRRSILDRQFKKRFTEIVQGLMFSFRVPDGWEFAVFKERYGADVGGIAVVERCHLSECVTHTNFAWGEILGRGSSETLDIGYFDVPCRISDLWREPREEGTHWKSEYGGMTAAIPFSWILASWEDDDGGTQANKRLARTQAGILKVGQRAVAEVQERVNNGTAGRFL